MGSFHCLVHGNLDTSVFRVRSSRKKRSSDKLMREVPSFLTLKVFGDFVADWLPGSNRIQKTLKRAYKALSNDVCLVPVPKLCLWKKGHFFVRRKLALYQQQNDLETFCKKILENEEEKWPYHFAGKYGAEWLLKLQTTFWNVSQAFLFGDKSVSAASGCSIGLKETTHYETCPCKWRQSGGRELRTASRSIVTTLGECYLHFNYGRIDATDLTNGVDRKKRIKKQFVIVSRTSWTHQGRHDIEIFCWCAYRGFQFGDIRQRNGRQGTFSETRTAKKNVKQSIKF